MISILLFVLVIGYLAFIFLPHYPSKDVFIADIDDPADVAEAFSYSLPFNRLEGMESYVIREKWDFIENWSATHLPISEKCHYPGDPDFQGHFLGGGNDRGGVSTAYISYSYDCPEYYYSFVADLELELIDNKWQVVG